MQIELQHLPADVLGLSDVARNALADRPHPAALPGMIVPAQLDDIPRLEEGFDSDQRHELQELLEAKLASFEPHVHVRDNLQQLTHPQAALVIAGQQPGLLGGPLYNTYKVISAIRLARALSERWQVPVLPAFWNHADDHDIAEVHHLWIQTQSLELRKVGLSGESSGKRPLSSIHFDKERHRLEAIAEILSQGIPNYASRGEAIELFMPRAGESFSNAFTRVLLELFGEQGLIVIEPDWIRAPLSRSLASVVTSDVARALDQGTQRLRAAGGEEVIDPAQAALLFHHIDGQRQALRLAEDGYRYTQETGSRTPTELAAEIIQAPGDYSAGALLRPLVQDQVLPTVAYIGGWGELAYHAQLPPLRKAAGVRQTAFVPRLSATLLDAAMDKSLAKLKLVPQQALAQRGELEVEPEAGEPSPAALELRAIAEQSKAQILALRAGLPEQHASMQGQLKKAASQVQTTLEKLALKLERLHDNAQGTNKRHARRIQHGLFPRSQPQERVLGPLEVYAQFGRQWIMDLIEEVEALPTEHVLVHLRQPEDSNEA